MRLERSSIDHGAQHLPATNIISGPGGAIWQLAETAPLLYADQEDEAFRAEKCRAANMLARTLVAIRHKLLSPLGNFDFPQIPFSVPQVH
jgi:hypothetical protein